MNESGRRRQRRRSSRRRWPRCFLSGGMSPLLLIIVLSWSPYVHCEVMKAKLAVSEGDVRYWQTMEYDPVERSLKVHVPQHNEIDESTTIYNIEKAVYVMLNHNLGECEVNDIPPEIDLEQRFMSAVRAEATGVRVAPSNAAITRYITYDKGFIESRKRRERMLSDNQLKLCEGYPLRRIIRLEVSQSEIESGQLMDLTDRIELAERKMSGSIGRRFKRVAFFSCDMTSICTTERIGMTCEWFVCVHLAMTDKCVNHMKSNRASCVVCCPSSGARLCKCNQIKTGDQFVKCQQRMRDIGIS